MYRICLISDPGVHQFYLLIQSNAIGTARWTTGCAATGCCQLNLQSFWTTIFEQSYFWIRSRKSNICWVQIGLEKCRDNAPWQPLTLKCFFTFFFWWTVKQRYKKEPTDDVGKQQRHFNSTSGGKPTFCRFFDWIGVCQSRLYATALKFLCISRKSAGFFSSWILLFVRALYEREYRGYRMWRQKVEWIMKNFQAVPKYSIGNFISIATTK